MAASPLQQLRAEHALLRSPIPALRNLRVEESESVVVITGSVGSYYLKQMAQETVMPVLGPRALQNRVAVVHN